MNKITLNLMFCIFLSNLIFAQTTSLKVIPEDNGEFTTQHIIENLILEGVKVVDIKTNFDYTDLCMGYFNDSSKQFGIEQGMILSTGSVVDISKANSESSYTSFGIDSTLLEKHLKYSLSDSIRQKDSLKYVKQMTNEARAKSSLKSDADLSNEIDGLTTYDARIIEIEFIPTADTFYYRYMFASEEYDEFVCSKYNDIFAFYVFQQEDEKKNTALVPIKNIPVSINNINNGNPNHKGCKKSNSYLYHSNKNGKGFLFDGYTKVLDIRFKVNPGEKYFIKIAIADASDPVLDSAVFIENSSIFSYFDFYEMFFLSDSYELQGFHRLNRILKSIDNHPKSKIQLIGHSDITGSEFYNLELSMKRVLAIEHYLIENGVDKSRIITKYKGELMPRYESHQKNRRVEVFILGE